ncbi:hypothetical protein U2F10_33415 [Leptothoe sp. EHU-05/26/07-4]
MIRRTLSYLLSTAVLTGMTAFGEIYGPYPPEPVFSTTASDDPKRLTISVSVADPEDLKVKEGDQVFATQLLADRGRERRQLEAQAKQLDLALHRLEVATITPPLPPATPPAIERPTYLEQNAAIDRAKANVDQAEAAIQAKHQEMAYLAELPNLNPLVLEHESANLAELQREHTAAARDYQLALGKRSTAEYEHSRAVAVDASARNRDQLSYQNQWAQYEQRLRDRDYQISQTRLKLDEIDNAIANLAIIRSPYAGRIRRVKWLGQDASGLLNVEITLMVRTSTGPSLSEQFDGLFREADSAGDSAVIRN